MIERLYEELRAELVGWCRSMTGDTSLAEELVQEAFLRAMFHETDLALLGHAQRRAWLYRTVKNLFIDRKRREKRQISLEEAQEGGLDIAAEPQWHEGEWIELLEALPDMEGRLFAMRYLQGFNSTQIGGILQMPAATVRSKLASARKHLREMIGG